MNLDIYVHIQRQTDRVSQTVRQIDGQTDGQTRTDDYRVQ